MAKYLTNGTYSGKAIIENMNENNQIKITASSGKKLTVNIGKKIDPHGVYIITATDTKVTIAENKSAWSCSKAEYDNMMKRGNEIVDRLFGDVFRDIEKTRR